MSQSMLKALGIDEEEAGREANNAARTEARRRALALERPQPVTGSPVANDDTFVPAPMSDTARQRLTAIREADAEADARLRERFDLERAEAADRVWQAQQQYDEALRTVDGLARDQFAAALKVLAPTPEGRAQEFTQRALGRAIEWPDVVVGRATALLGALQEFVGIAPDSPSQHKTYFERIDGACGPGTALRWRSDHQWLGQQLANQRGFFRPTMRTSVALTVEVQELLAIVREMSS